jgi:hypothetical protein
MITNEMYLLQAHGAAAKKRMNVRYSCNMT